MGRRFSSLVSEVLVYLTRVDYTHSYYDRQSKTWLDSKQKEKRLMEIETKGLYEECHRQQNLKNSISTSFAVGKIKGNWSYHLALHETKETTFLQWDSWLSLWVLHFPLSTVSPSLNEPKQAKRDSPQDPGLVFLRKLLWQLNNYCLTKQGNTLRNLGNTEEPVNCYLSKTNLFLGILNFT